MSDCKPCSMPVDTQAKVSSDMGAPSATRLPTVSWLGLSSTSPSPGPTLPTRSKRCLHMHDPHEPHLTTAKRILRYLQGTLNHGLLLRSVSTSDLIVYTDADWVGCPNTHRSTSGYAVFLCDNLVTWSSKCQNVISV
jgi:hypothetical protein